MTVGQQIGPDKFLPYRLAKRHNEVYISSSAGPRNCRGQTFALLELKTELSYRLHSVDNRDTVNLLIEFTMMPEGGIKLTITAREREEIITSDGCQGTIQQFVVKLTQV
jgi:cytochrome P450